MFIVIICPSYLGISRTAVGVTFVRGLDAALTLILAPYWTFVGVLISFYHMLCNRIWNLLQFICTLCNLKTGASNRIFALRAFFFFWDAVCVNVSFCIHIPFFCSYDVCISCLSMWCGDSKRHALYFFLVFAISQCKLNEKEGGGGRRVWKWCSFFFLIGLMNSSIQTEHTKKYKLASLQAYSSSNVSCLYILTVCKSIRRSIRHMTTNGALHKQILRAIYGGVFE